VFLTFVSACSMRVILHLLIFLINIYSKKIIFFRTPLIMPKLNYNKIIEKKRVTHVLFSFTTVVYWQSILYYIHQPKCVLNSDVLCTFTVVFFLIRKWFFFFCAACETVFNVSCYMCKNNICIFTIGGGDDVLYHWAV
jgi:hypothetical protein